MLGGFYTKPRIILVGKSQKDARRLIEAFDDRFDVRYVEEVSDEAWRYSDVIIFDYVNKELHDKTNERKLPYLFLVGDEKNIKKYELEIGEYLLKGPGYLHYLPEIVFSLLEKQRLQKILDFEREKYMGLVNSMGCGMFVLRKRDGSILFSNQVVTEIFGYEKSELEKSRLQDIVASDADIISDILNEEEMNNAELVMFNIDGEKMYVRFNSSEMVYGAEKVILFTFMDITRHVKDQKELIFQWQFLDNADEIAIATDNEGKIVYLNKFAARIHGYPKEELLGSKESDFISASPEEIGKRKMELSRTGKWKGEETRIKKDGSTFISDVIRSLISIEGNKYELIIASDITEKLELQKNLKLHSLFLKEASDIAIATDIEGNIIYMNEAAERFLSMELTRVKSKGLKEVGLESLLPLLDIIGNGNSRFGKRKSIAYKTGINIVVVEFTSHVVKDDSGKDVAIIFMGRDISNFQKILEKLNTEAELLDNLKAMIVACDMQGKIVYANKSWLYEMGYGVSKNVFGTKLIPNFIPMDLEKRNKIKSEISSKGKWQGKIELLRKNGDKVETEATVVRLIDESGYFIADMVMVLL